MELPAYVFAAVTAQTVSPHYMLPSQVTAPDEALSTATAFIQFLPSVCTLPCMTSLKLDLKNFPH